VVSVGSTPTALSATSMDGVTEVRAGVYAFMDLVMANIGVCTPDDIALSVLATVIGHQRDKGWALVDAGWMAMSRDRGTQSQACDYGYGQVCDAAGRVLPGWLMTGANQEHGIVAFDAAKPGAGAAPADIVQALPVGTQLRILPNHACATAAQFDGYTLLAADGTLGRWPRWNHW
jgi:D-serine deaminase-like pyridoxal phosphate-dependent protein